MTRPTEHGGGDAAPPIAGDPGSFPADAELARTLMASRSRAALSTLTAEGFPFGSVVSYALADDGDPVVLISEMAEHTVNARGDDRASMLVTADVPGDADPLSAARCTLVGRLQLIERSDEVRAVYLDRHPQAAYYVDFTDFGFWALRVEQCRFVGGFGHMSWVGPDRYRSAEVDPVAGSAGDIVAHMNADHREANLAYVQVLAGLDEATAALMTGIDRYGVTVEATTPKGARLARIPFPEPLISADDARPAVIELLNQARAARTAAD